MFRQLIKDYFSFTQKERIAVITLILVIVCVYLVPHFIKPATRAVAASEVQEFRMLEQQIAKVYKKHRNNQNRNDNGDKDENKNEEDYATVFNPPSSQEDGNMPARLFYFDPNSIAEKEWKQLGLRDKTIGTIQKYLARGGHFYKATDLKKIYGLRANEYERIMPYIRITGSAKEVGDSSATDHLPSDYSGGYSANKSSATLSLQDQITTKTNSSNTARPNNRFVRHIVDINTADTTELIALPGIGSKLASRIVNFREKLGGFHGIEQVGETYGLADSTFQKIRPLLNLGKTALRKIDINTADIETLKQHPYIKWSIANALLRYKDQHGAFKNVEELQQIAAVSPEAYKKMLPYLMIGGETGQGGLKE